MNLLRFTLVTDGSSDVVLIPILEWLLRQAGVTCPLQGHWADFRDLPSNQPKTLEEKIARAFEIHPCEILFVHRDAERIQKKQTSLRDIACGKESNERPFLPPYICVVPVRMQEAWLLFDEKAIRRAAGNPNGKQKLKLPPLSKIESKPDPKATLHECLTEASGYSGRRKKNFNAGEKAHLVPESIQDFSPLLKLSAFRSLRKDLALILAMEKNRWNP